MTSLTDTNINELWQNFCDLRLKSQAYRAADDPLVKQAHEKWRHAYEQDDITSERDNVVAFPLQRRTIRRRGAA